MLLSFHGLLWTSLANAISIYLFRVSSLLVKDRPEDIRNHTELTRFRDLFLHILVLVE